MGTKKATAKTTNSATATSAASKPQGKVSLSLSRKNVLTGDLPPMLDLREIKLTHKGTIRIEDNDAIECIHLPDGEFSCVVITNLPNLKEIHAHGGGPTWLDCQSLPSLKTLIIDSGTRWLNVDQADHLIDIDVGNCEQLGYLSVQLAPQLSRVNIEQCRLLPNIQGISTNDQDRLGLTGQMLAAQAMSNKNLLVCPEMTWSDIEWVLDNIRRGLVHLKMRFPNEDEEIGVTYVPPSFSYRLLQPGEKVYTGGTGESYCYAFEITTQETKGKKFITNVLSARGIHEPEEAIGEALRWVISTLGLPVDVRPSDDQLLSYLNLLASAAGSDPGSWIKTDGGALRLALAANPLMPSPALEQLGRDKSPQVRLAVAGNPALTFQIRQNLLRGLVTEKDPGIRFCVAQSAATAPEDLQALAENSDTQTLCALAENPVCPSTLRAEILETLSTCGETTALLLVASSADTPEHVFPGLLACADQRVIMAIAENTGAPGSVRSSALARLAGSEDLQVKRSVAGNKLTPPTVLDSLASDPDFDLLGIVAQNLAAPPFTLETLAKSNDSGVRCGVANNPSTPPSALLLLSKDKDPFWGEYIRKAVAGNTSTPEDAFRFLLKDKDWQTRNAIAKNIASPKDVLEALAKDKEYSVRESVARNVVAPPNVLDILSAEKKDNIKMHVARNPNASVDILTRLAVDPYLAIRREVALNAGTPSSVLQELAKDAEPEVRLAAENSLAMVGAAG